MKTVRKALERAARALKSQSKAIDDIKAALERIEPIEAKLDLIDECLADILAFVEYCEHLPGRAHSAAFDTRLQRARQAIDKLTGNNT